MNHWIATSRLQREELISPNKIHETMLLACLLCNYYSSSLASRNYDLWETIMHSLFGPTLHFLGHNSSFSLVWSFECEGAKQSPNEAFKVTSNCILCCDGPWEIMSSLNQEGAGEEGVCNGIQIPTPQKHHYRAWNYLARIGWPPSSYCVFPCPFFTCIICPLSPQSPINKYTMDNGHTWNDNSREKNYLIFLKKNDSIYFFILLINSHGLGSQ